MFDHVIDDSTTADHLLNAGYRGLDVSALGRGYGGAAEPFPDSLIVPRSEWQARIAEMEATKTRLSDLVDAAGLPPKDQQSTLYCWANATTHTQEIVRAKQGQRQVLLSPASVGGPLTGFRNHGGFGPDALAFLASNGAVPIDLWPANAIDSRYYTEAAKQASLAYRITRWVEALTIDQTVSLLFHRIPVAVGLSWWGHEVTYYDPVWKDGDIAIRFRNSWGLSYGDRGYAILQGRRMVPDDAVAPYSTTAS